MTNLKKKNDALEILHRRYIGDDPVRQASLQEERVHAEVARKIYELRQKANLSQKELANLVGTTQSVISRLEDADYEGHSLSMLSRIANALSSRITVGFVPIESKNPAHPGNVYRKPKGDFGRARATSVERCSNTFGSKGGVAMAGKKGDGQKIGRDAESGKFIPVDKAKKNPKTTVVETIKPSKKKKLQISGKP